MIEIKHKETGAVLHRVDADSLEGQVLAGKKLAGADLKTLLPYGFYNLFTYVLTNHESITNRDIKHEGKVLNGSVFLIEKGKIVGAVIRDMSAPEVQKEEVVKRLTEAIDKNLSLVQQIGFIMGEGAA